MNQGIVIASFGERPYLRQLVERLRQQLDLPIRLYTEQDRGIKGVETCVLPDKDILWNGHLRQWIRMTNLVLASAARDDFETTLCLNDDMKIVHPSFVEGFWMAERFGVCVPLNPRVYVQYNAAGADGNDFLGASRGPACNVSPMFVCNRIKGVREFLSKYIAIMLDGCYRGTLAFWNASWLTGFTPLYLPEMWCVCESNAAYLKNYKKTLQGKEYPIEPIMLHWGQAGVREVFG